MSQSTMSTTEVKLRELLKQRILILDGAMGTMIQQYKLTEAEYRAERFANFKAPVGQRELFVKGIMSYLHSRSRILFKKYMKNI